MGFALKVALIMFAAVVHSLSCVRLFATPWTVAYQAPLSVGFSRQQYRSGLPFPSPWDLPDPGIKPGSPALQTDTLLSEPPSNQLHLIGPSYFHYSFLSCATHLTIIDPMTHSHWKFIIKATSLMICHCCCCSAAQSCPTLCSPMDCSTPGFPILHHLQSLLKLMSIESVVPSNHLILCRPLLFLPLSFPSSRSFLMTWIFTSGSQSIRVSASAAVLPMNIQGSFQTRIDCFDLLAVQDS